MSNEITKELFQKAKQANSAEELKALAKENGVALTDEQAAALFSKLNASGELSEDELNSVSGGGCSSSSSSDGIRVYKAGTYGKKSYSYTKYVDENGLIHYVGSGLNDVSGGGCS